MEPFNSVNIKSILFFLQNLAKDIDRKNLSIFFIKKLFLIKKSKILNKYGNNCWNLPLYKNLTLHDISTSMFKDSKALMKPPKWSVFLIYSFESRILIFWKGSITRPNIKAFN